MNIPKKTVEEIGKFFSRAGHERTDTQSFVYRSAEEVLAQVEFMNDAFVSVDDVHLSYHDGNAVVTCELKEFINVFYDKIADGHLAVVRMQPIVELEGKRVADIDVLKEGIKSIDFNMDPQDVKEAVIKLIGAADLSLVEVK